VTAYLSDPTALALLAQICADPADDGSRLILADRLDELGAGERAEFVRAQVELARRECREDWCEKISREKYPIGKRCEQADECDALRRRAGELLAAYGRAWAAPVVHAIKGNDSQFFDWVATHADFHSNRTVRWTWGRGFMSSLTLSAADLLAHGDALLWSPGQTDECPQVTWRVVHGTVDAETRQRKRRDGLTGPCPPWCEGGCKGTGRVHRPCPATAQPVEEVTLTTTPGVEYGSGDRLRLFGCRWFHVNETADELDRLQRASPPDTMDEFANQGRDDYLLLRLTWPSVRTWHLPPEHPRDAQGRWVDEATPWTAEDVARVLNGDPAAPVPLGVIDAAAESPSAAPPDNARRRPGHSRLPAWLAEQRQNARGRR